MSPSILLNPALISALAAPTVVAEAPVSRGGGRVSVAGRS